MREIKLMPDYDCYPLWEAGDQARNIDPSTLPISEELQSRLKSWARIYDATLDPSYPPNSGFHSPDTEAAFEREGLRLRKALSDELGSDYRVLYFSQKEGRLLSTGEIEERR